MSTTATVASGTSVGPPPPTEFAASLLAPDRSVAGISAEVGAPKAPDKARQNLSALVEQYSTRAIGNSFWGLVAVYRTEVEATIQAIRSTCESARLLLDSSLSSIDRHRAFKVMEQAREDVSIIQKRYSGNQVLEFNLIHPALNCIDGFHRAARAFEKERVANLQQKTLQDFPSSLGLDPAVFSNDLPTGAIVPVRNLILIADGDSFNLKLAQVLEQLPAFTSPAQRTATSQALGYALAGAVFQIGYANLTYGSNELHERVRAMVAGTRERDIDFRYLGNVIAYYLNSGLPPREAHDVIAQFTTSRQGACLERVLTESLDGKTTASDRKLPTLEAQEWIFRGVRVYRTLTEHVDAQSQLCLKLEALPDGLGAEELLKNLRIEEWLNTFGDLKRRASLQKATAMLNETLRGMRADNFTAEWSGAKGRIVTALITHIGNYAKRQERSEYLAEAHGYERTEVRSLVADALRAMRQRRRESK